jgi:uncharacterized protein (DUF488 family)
MKIYTIGFAGKSAEEFFKLLINSGIERVVDIRLNNISQMAGFTKKNDLKYFLHEIARIEYVHLPVFAPEKEMLEEYRQSKDWTRFEMSFKELLERRRPLEQVDTSLFTEKVCCLLCSEPESHQCHRRLVAEYLSTRLDNCIEIIHL